MIAFLTRAALLAAAIGGLALPAAAKPAACVSDAELDAAVGADIRAGAAVVSTAGLGDRPLCSGLSLTQAIQQLRERYIPAEPPAPLHDGPIREGAAALPVPSRPALPGGEVLEQYVGQLPDARINGRRFLEQPAVITALTRAGVDPGLRRSLDRYDVVSPIDREGSIVIDGGCIAGHCDTNNYRLYIDARTGIAALCLFQVSESIWYSPATGRVPRPVPKACPESPADAPARIRSALGIPASYSAY